MSDDFDPGALLDALLTATPAARPELLRAAGPLPEVLMALGDESEQLVGVEVAQALAATDVVIALADGVALARPRARARRARAMALSYAGRLQEALAVGAEAATIARAGQEPVEAARATLASVNALARLGRFEEAIAAGEAARAALLAAGEPALAARADVNLGAVYDMQDDPARAVRHYDRARPALTADPIALAQLETNRGTALQGLDEFVAAEAAFLTALEMFESAGLGWAAAIAAGNLAHLATRQGRLERALHEFERARRHLEADDSPAELARLRAEQAQALVQLGLRDEAIAAYEAVLPQLDAIDAAPEAAAARFGLAQALLLAGRAAEAEPALTEAARAFTSLGQPIMRARIDITWAALLIDAGRPDEAHDLLTDALPALIDRPVDQLTAHYQLARLAYEAGDLPEAAAALAVAMPIATALDIAPVLADLLHLRALVASARGETAAALADLRTAVARIERVRGALQAERFRAAFLGNRLAIYESLITSLLDMGDLVGAFAVTEQAKSRALLDLVSGALDLNTATASATPAEAVLLSELARLSQELNWSYSRLDDPGGEHDPAAWARTVRAQELALQELQERIASGRGLAALYSVPADLAAVSAVLPRHTALIEFVIAGNELIAFVLGGAEPRVVRHLATRVEAIEYARQIRFQLGRAIAAGPSALTGPRAPRLLAEAQRVLGEAFDALLRPVLALVDPTTVALVIVPHGPLHGMPLHALWDGAQYVIERYRVQFAPSASLLALPGESVGDGDRGAVVVGVADALAPRIEDEALAVAALLDDPRPLLGGAATVAAVAAAIAPAGVVHLACHGRFVPSSPLASGLKLADGWLTARDIYQLRLAARLVTLSGCDTGRTAVTDGDELNGLLRGFFAAGAAAVVMSLWTVDDASTTALMDTFYTSWRGGDGVVAALQTAQLAALVERPHPAFWAPFLVGGKHA